MNPQLWHTAYAPRCAQPHLLHVLFQLGARVVRRLASLRARDISTATSPWRCMLPLDLLLTKNVPTVFGWALFSAEQQNMGMSSSSKPAGEYQGKSTGRAFNTVKGMPRATLLLPVQGGAQPHRNLVEEGTGCSNSLPHTPLDRKLPDLTYALGTTACTMGTPSGLSG